MRVQLSLRIAREEWRYWLRSRLAIAASLCALSLVIASLASTVLSINTERIARESFQAVAEQTFREQPSRHPHRMVHYGHYVFRTPAPLAVIDPGVDAHAGTILFLEGHRQNSAVFSTHYTSAQAGPLSQLTPAFTYQVLVPLLLIVIGFSSVSREREGKTDYLIFSSAVTPFQLWLGKAMALLSVAALALTPLAITLIIATTSGESWIVSFSFFLGYLIYLSCWVTLVTAMSAWAKYSTLSLSLSLASWVVLCVVVPKIAGTTADAMIPLQGKVTTDLKVTRALREVGDGHNASDPAFQKLQAQLLAQYHVESVEDLPINIRGIVAEAAEADLTDVMNTYAEQQMAQEAKQINIVHWLGLLSPALAVRSFSLTTASTDLRQYHRFLREAEELRFDFVQQLNTLHANELVYADDIQRSNDPEAEQRTRVDAENWRLLKNFSWQPDPVAIRLIDGLPHILILLLWCVFSAAFGIKQTQKMFGDYHD